MKLKAISPIDGRYSDTCLPLQSYFSEMALIKYRVYVEVQYLKALRDSGIAGLQLVDQKLFDKLELLPETMDEAEVQKIKEIEKVTNHDVKAVEYYIKEKLIEWEGEDMAEFVHFGLTSQDINNTAFPMMLKDGLYQVVIPTIDKILKLLGNKAQQYNGIPMLARTHGQPASPTTVGKEIEVFIERMHNQIILLKALPFEAKFGGATGNLNAHKVSFPDEDWIQFSNNFVNHYLDLNRLQKTTQIAHYDGLAAIFDVMSRISTILIDFCRDMWTYISMDYFTQKAIEGEVGSSAMPHKVNPIDFENAEGNLGLAIAIFTHLSHKLPISRLQRDLTDSTVLRNVGVPIAHFYIALLSIEKGLSKIDLNRKAINDDLNKHWVVLAEAIQNILRREKYPKPYEKLKELTRGKSEISKEDIHHFISELDIEEEIKEELYNLSPFNYIGYF